MLPTIPKGGPAFADQVIVRLFSPSYHLHSLIITFYDTSRILSDKNMFTFQWGVLNGRRLSEALRAFPSDILVQYIF
jgi:hypothetical protein